MAKTLPLYSSAVSLGWRVVRYVKPCEAEKLLARGAAERCYDSLDRLAGYRLVAWETSVGSRSASTITVAEVQANAGTRFAGGKSRTAGLSEVDRLLRVHSIGHGASMEDFVERAQQKLDAWPTVS